MSHRYIDQNKQYGHSKKKVEQPKLHVEHGELFRGETPTGIILDKDEPVKEFVTKNSVLIGALGAAAIAGGIWAIKSMAEPAKGKAKSKVKAAAAKAPARVLKKASKLADASSVKAAAKPVKAAAKKLAAKPAVKKAAKVVKTAVKAKKAISSRSGLSK